MMKPGIELEPAYKLLAEYRQCEYRSEKLGMEDDVEYWYIKQCGIQNALNALTGEWPIALADDREVTVCHGSYEQTFDF